MTETTPPTPPAPPPPPLQPYGQQQPYGAQPYPYTGQLVPRTNTLAIVALVLGLTVSLGGIICGHIALSQIKRTGESGRGLALAGLIIGYVFTGITLLYIIGAVAVIAAGIGTGAYTTT